MAGIYIHIPFCKNQCSYCDFHFSTTFESYRERMLNNLAKELNERSNYLEDQRIETIYFGGGTPSLLKESELKMLIDTVREKFRLSDALEITLEANPDDCSLENLSAWKSIGINRLSIGVQSFKAEDLKWMNRAHTVEEATSCVLLAKSVGFDLITVDLMYGLPNLAENEWREHIQTVVAWGVNHISSYCLTVESNTALHKWVRDGKIVPANDEAQSRQFEILLETLLANGFEQYEISNFCKAGHESKHNSNYWKGAWYLGIGPSAHSFNGTERRWNVSNNAKYMHGVESGDVFSETEVLTSRDRFNEMVMTGLRTKYGVHLAALAEVHEIPEEIHSRIKEFQAKNWLVLADDTVRLTPEGRLKADFIASDLFLVD